MRTNPLLNGCSITALLTRSDFIKLGCHLANGLTGKLLFIGSMGEPVCRDMRRRSVLEAVTSTWNCIQAYDPLMMKPFALAVYDRNESTQQSTFGAIDLDWHHLGTPGPYEIRAAALLWLSAVTAHQAGECDALILESSGRGCHVWLITRTARDVGQWAALLRAVVTRAKCEGFPGLELLPMSAHGSGKGKALRLPGAVNPLRFNPRDGSPISRIVDQVGLKALCSSLEESASINKPVYHGSATPTTSEAQVAKQQESNWLSKHRIEQPGTRHTKSRALIVQATCHRPPQDILRLCDELYADANPHPLTSLDDHREDCERMLTDWIEKLCQLFTDEERASFSELATDRDRLAWHCLHNWHRLSLIQGGSDFPVSSEALGRAIGFSYKTALEVLKSFVARGFIRQASPAVKRVRCARYLWNLDHLSAEAITRKWPLLTACASNIKANKLAKSIGR